MQSRLPLVLLAIVAGAVPLMWMAMPQSDSDATGPQDSGPGATGPAHNSAQERQTLPSGLTSLTSITIGPGAVVDDVRSPIETYLEGRSESMGQADLWAIDAVTLQAHQDGNPTTIVGHARPAWHGQVDIEKGAFVTGSIEARGLQEKWPELPIVTRPAGSDRMVAEGRYTLTGEETALSTLQLSGEAELLLRGPLTCILDRLICTDASRIAVDTSAGPVQLRILKEWSMGSGTTWTSRPEDTSRFALLVGEGKPKLAPDQLLEKTEAEIRAQRLRERLHGGRQAQENAPMISLSANGQFHGLVYAPFSELTVPKGLHLFGTAVVFRLLLAEGARTTCDPAALTAWVANR